MYDDEDFSFEMGPEVIELITEDGDDIEALAFAFETTPEAIAALNSDLDLFGLVPEQVVRIPRPPQRCQDGTRYVIRQGDTIESIARRFGVTAAAIYRENPFLLVIGVRPGLAICIPQAPADRCPGGVIYTVEAGDTLFAIAARFRTTVEAILRANPGLDPNRLFVGQRICIPSSQPPRCPGFTYTVVLGDTLFLIATRFNTTVNAILQANPGLDPNRLFVGQQICIPAAPPRPCPGIQYTVVGGDTLNSIAFRFNTTVAAILQLNPGLNPDFLVPGQRICLPQRPPSPGCPGVFYTVVAGDTLFAIAARFNTTVDAILRVNPGLDPNRLFIGQQICIPR